jgi:glycine dehydrogenase subunit 1
MRFLPHTDADRTAMLDAMGLASMNELFSDIPSSFLLEKGSLNLTSARSEAEIMRHIMAEADRNRHAGSMRCFLGAGTYHHFIPAAVNYIISRGEFLTAYTPYQPEIAQGTLQALFEFQTMIARLTGMEIANASMYDAATSLAEAALMARRITKRTKIVLSRAVNPRYRRVAKNYLGRLEGDIEEAPCRPFGTDIEALHRLVDEKTACVIVQYPDFFGSVFDLAAVRSLCDSHGCLFIVAFSDVSAFGLITPPGHFGADIVVGSGQSLGIPMAFGGPHLGLFACKQTYLRQMPGRICGMTSDIHGRRGFVLTLSTREQHIRRDRATSNICTNQGLMCTAAAVYLSLLGDVGLRTVAERSAAALQYLISGLPAHVRAADGARYNETVLSFANRPARDRFLMEAEKKGIFAGIPLEQLEKGHNPRHLLVATTEMINTEDISDYLRVMETST